MIVTVTLNTAMDRTLLVPNFQLGQRHRASLALSSAGGKGVNVARALRHLGVPVVATLLAREGEHGAAVGGIVLPALGQALARRGHDVVVAAGPALAGRVSGDRAAAASRATGRLRG